MTYSVCVCVVFFSLRRFCFTSIQIIDTKGIYSQIASWKVPLPVTSLECKTIFEKKKRERETGSRCPSVSMQLMPGCKAEINTVHALCALIEHVICAEFPLGTYYLKATHKLLRA